MVSKAESINSQTALNAAVEYAKAYDLDPQGVVETAEFFFNEWLLGHMEGTEVAPSPAPNRRSPKRGSSSRQSNRGRDRNSGGYQIKDPDAPATDAQIGKAIAEGALDTGYTRGDLEGMTKGDISNLIEDLIA